MQPLIQDHIHDWQRVLSRQTAVQTCGSVCGSDMGTVCGADSGTDISCTTQNGYQFSRQFFHLLCASTRTCVRMRACVRACVPTRILFFSSPTQIPTNPYPPLNHNASNLHFRIIYSHCLLINATNNSINSGNNNPLNESFTDEP